MAQLAASFIRVLIFSPRNSQLINAIIAGMPARMTPADTAVVMLTPYNMQIENRKLPTNDSRNSRVRTWGVIAASWAGLRNQGSIATAAMPKRIQPSRNTGRAATSGLESAT